MATPTKIKAGAIHFQVADGAGALWFCVTDREENHAISGFVTPAEVKALRDRMTDWLRDNPVEPQDAQRFDEAQKTYGE